MLVAMLWLATTGMSQTMVSMNTPSNQEYIDNLFNTVVNFIMVMIVNQVARHVGETSLW